MTKVRSLRGGLAVLAAGNLLGKAVALIREVVFASAFGTSSTAAGFRVAQSLSFVPANLVASDVLSAAFAPSYARAAQRDDSLAAGLLRGYALTVAAILTAVAIASMLFTEQIVALTIPGAAGGTRAAATAFLRVLVWSIPLYGVSAVMALALAARGIFLAQSVRPLLQSVGLLAGTGLAIATGRTMWLALAFTVGWAVYCSATVLVCLRRGLFSGAQSWPHSQVFGFMRSDLSRASPLLALPLLIQASIVLERTLASMGPPELLASVDYARTIADSVVSLIAVPLGLIGLTHLAVMAGKAFDLAVTRVVDVVVAVVTPLSMMILSGAGMIVTLLYERGSFSPTDGVVTTAVLTGHALLMPAQVLGYFLSRALVASGRAKTVLAGTAAAIIAQVATQGLVVTGVGPLALGLGPSMYGLVMTAWFATALGLVRRVGWAFVAQVPVILTGVLSALVAASMGAELAGTAAVALVWLLTVACSPSLKSLLRREVFTPLTRAVQTRRNGH